MKITESEIKQLIDEEIQAMIESGEIDEGILDRLKARASGVGSKIAGAGRGAIQKGLGAIASVGGEEEMAQTMRDRAAATKAGAADKALAKKTLSILQSHLRSLAKDLKKLGLDTDSAGIKQALSGLQRAVATQSLNRRAGTAE